MSDPARMLYDDADDLEAALLRSARNDAPPFGAQRRVFARLGIASGATATVIAAAGGASAEKGGASLASVLSAKALGTIFLVAALGVAGVWFAQARTGASLPERASAVSTPALVPSFLPESGPPLRGDLPRALPAEPPALGTPSALSTGERALRAPAAQLADRPHPPVRAREKAHARAHTLENELAVLQRARDSVSAGMAASALEALDEYDREYPAGQLAQEATVLRIDALARVGRRASAKSLAEAFLANHTASPVAAKVRGMLAAIVASEDDTATKR